MITILSRTTALTGNTTTGADDDVNDAETSDDDLEEQGAAPKAQMSPAEFAKLVCTACNIYAIVYSGLH